MCKPAWSLFFLLSLSSAAFAAQQKAAAIPDISGAWETIRDTKRVIVDEKGGTRPQYQAPALQQARLRPEYQKAREERAKAAAEADARGEIDWNVSVDSTIARVHQHGATAARSEVTVTAHTGGSVELQGIAG